MQVTKPKIAVVMPAYRVRQHILPLLSRIGPEVTRIYCVDDCCPDGSGKYVEANCKDPRVRVLVNPINLGVGGAMVSGYLEAIKEGYDIVVKIDGDDQMDPALILDFIQPIVSGQADYTKGNRFHSVEGLQKMPVIRLLGNSILSFVNKVSSGYWTIMDPTNGYTAIHCKVLKLLPLEKIEKRYFFESDILFRLNTVRAFVCDIPMHAVYGDEVSNLSIRNTALSFPMKYLSRFFKRIIYSYLLRDFNAGSIQLLAGLPLIFFGVCYGAINWFLAYSAQTSTSNGVIMLAALPIILGFQFLISALSYDVANTPQKPIHPLIH